MTWTPEWKWKQAGIDNSDDDDDDDDDDNDDYGGGDGGGVLHPFQHYLSHIEIKEGW